MSLRAQHLVPAPRSVVWRWHSQPGAVSRLTPPFLPMTPIEEAANLRNGETVFTLPGGLRWQARHQPDAFTDGRKFQDACVNEPLATATQWRHTHSFIDHPAGTVIDDHVETTAPGFVLHSAFAYRQRQLIADLESLNRLADVSPATATYREGKPLTIAVTGTHGGVGSRLVNQVTTAGHEVIRLVRGTADADQNQRHWDPDAPADDLLAGVDAVAHLAGAPIFGRFTEEHKRDIYTSRVEPTRKLARLAAETDSVRTFVTASAIGFYGYDRDDEVLAEDSEQGDGFLAQCVADWEAATLPAQASDNVRVAHVRSGISLAGNAGLLPLLAAAFSTGLGGPFGKGDFWFSWVSVDDLTDVYFRALVDDSLSGPINATAPNPVSNRTMAKELGKVLHRPAAIPLPTFAPAVLLDDQGARELALADQRVRPTVLQHRGHEFRYKEIGQALRHELGGEKLWENSQLLA